MSKSKNYCFIHGAWHASWCFTKLAAMLQERGHKVFLCDLPGHYNNSWHNICDFSKITLGTYVNYTCDFIQQNIEGEVILVGHSMGGVVVSQVAENLGSKIGHLVYISGFIPDKNGSLFEEEAKSKRPTVALKVKIDKNSFAISLEPDDCKQLFYNMCCDEDVRFALSKIQSQPLLVFNSKVSLGDNFAKVAKTYIECLQDNAILLEDQRRMNKICKNIVSLDSDHSPFFSSTQKLATILMSVN